jgi:hypothetical protein
LSGADNPAPKIKIKTEPIGVPRIVSVRYGSSGSESIIYGSSILEDVAMNEPALPVVLPSYTRANLV